MKGSTLLSFVALAIAADAQGATYTLSSSLSGQAFLNAFEWQAIADPTNGRVNYVSQTTAQADGLYSVSGSSVTLRADDTTVLDASVSILHTCLKVAELGPLFGMLRYFPEESHLHGFPSFSFLIAGKSVPIGQMRLAVGEVDIVEGVNDQSPNQSTLHTSANCTMPTDRTMTGTSEGTNCDVNETNNSGCGVAIADDNSYGPDFNGIGGGWYAIERSATYISIYFWERGSSSVPSEVSTPGNTVDTSTWGEPAAYFPSTDCDFSTHFGPHNIIINLTFCGDWAGNSAVYAASACPSTCVDYVNANPTAFTDAYFEFNSLNIYE
ncbi:glycoside hydrolase family 16 protein [Hydnomerulius pinastri MD-312]|uniref:Glycoside hydrolase family 16 protein n=1 Tax=Hydnomerulius pinastri MD-312 TaxID=994086 RepID=A0A0C9VDB0_9AGAM|nr:glycoside hydrolase family 16 protein [Hydnomerulius pinastri MD-312]